MFKKFNAILWQDWLQWVFDATKKRFCKFLKPISLFFNFEVHYEFHYYPPIFAQSLNEKPPSQ